MNAKERFYSGLAKETIGKITSNTDNWTSFLRTMSRNYEFTYPEQVMIYAQRPNATFCKPYEDWNAENYRRYVKRGSTGIALFVMNRDKPYLRYVFDVADTGVRRSSPELKPWEVTPENRSYVMEAMERTFGVAADGVLEAQLEDIASALAAEYWDDYKKQFLDIVANSFLEEYDELNIEVAFKNAVANSVCEYAPLVERLHGQVIHISPASTQYINPMDINSNYSEEDNPLALKADFVLSLCELVVGGKEGLQPVEKTVIDRCVHVVYRKYFENPTPENMPLLEDLYNALLTQDEPEARHVAAALEIYVKGSLNIFNHHTNVDINNRIVCFDIKQLGKQLKKLGMLIVQDAVWGRVTANREAGKSTRYYADEFHLLLKEEQTAAYSVEIWKRFRKWGGIPTALTQNVKDLLASPEVSNIFENSDFVYMLNQANGDRQILAKQLNISPHQLSYVTHSGEGEGLLFFGNVILPFVDHFPKDLELYRILTTRLSEVAEAQKHE